MLVSYLLIGRTLKVIFIVEVFGFQAASELAVSDRSDEIIILDGDCTPQGRRDYGGHVGSRVAFRVVVLNNYG